MHCRYCNKLCKSENSKRQHELRCKHNPDSLSMDYAKVTKYKIISDTPCKFCRKIFTTNGGLSNHERRCKENPERKIETLSSEGKYRISNATKQKNLTYFADEGNRLNHKQSMQSAVERYPESYSSCNANRSKKTTYDNIRFDSLWEIDFYKWCEINNIECIRNKKGFKYTFSGTRTYFPDFFLPNQNMYVEVKGREIERDRIKWAQFPFPIYVLRLQEINQIRQGIFTPEMLQLTKYKI